MTRFPEPGKTKTRLIPQLGAEGAARLQRRMSERTLAQADRLAEGIAVEIHFTGGTRSQMEDWLGRDRVYREQCGADLGERLKSVFAAAFDEGIERAVAIGIDCPQLETELLERAFEQLKSRDVVLGPAVDGGYYLIGLRRRQNIEGQPMAGPFPGASLFDGIAWGSDRAFAQTLALARDLGYAIGELPILHDVDYPEDLPLWERHARDFDFKD